MQWLCRAHTINLLLQDVSKLEDVQQTVTGAETITAYFMKRPQLLARFKEEKLSLALDDSTNASGRSFSVSVPTRWYSSYQSLVNVIRNKEAVICVFNDDEFMEADKGAKRRRRQPAPVVPTTTSRKRKVIRLLSPIIKKLGLLESDRCCIFLVYWAFPISSLVEARWNFAHTEAMGIAYYLDPAQDPRRFVNNDQGQSKDQIEMVARRLGFAWDSTSRHTRPRGTADLASPRICRPSFHHEPRRAGGIPCPSVKKHANAGRGS
ncbi:hypothetical protein PHYSODRAFT_532090 [Phytophthora sojae]|uniref:Uncharacterized protein n=1 Tax=Phytophthora sojae (strain P6497) TaxID=1094619 RepID=G5AEH2_PHYSP|nr:hypothetical protein PHYSODRAFT_532090 [Phytophthora sojae]EGZ06574.1 hypothetical protein PHYSODRAFT_532090 [Phytophthora sojae]|eukprot:XP_009538471.1 hypothetical protein PHYSODRAFT_532090 [Phytophthora sojae]